LGGTDGGKTESNDSLEAVGIDLKFQARGLHRLYIKIQKARLGKRQENVDLPEKKIIIKKHQPKKEKRNDFLKC